MKKIAAVLMLIVLLVGVTGVLAGPPDEPPTPQSGRGPAPNSGDGVPDGSGYEDNPPYQGDLPDSDDGDNG